jgi:hypothetical protein
VLPVQAKDEKDCIGDDEIRVSAEKHYRLVRPEDLTAEELASYRTRSL